MEEDIHLRGNPAPCFENLTTPVVYACGSVKVIDLFNGDKYAKREIMNDKEIIKCRLSSCIYKQYSDVYFEER